MTELLSNGSSVQRIELPLETWRRHKTTADLNAAIDRTTTREPLAPLVARSRVRWGWITAFAVALVVVVAKVAL